MSQSGSYIHTNAVSNLGPAPTLQREPGAAVIAGTVHNDILRGDDRDNVFLSSAGRDYIEGGGGFDAVSYYGRPESLRIVLGDSSVSSVYMEDFAATRVVNDRVLSAQQTPLRADASAAAPESEESPAMTVVYTHKDTLRDIDGLVGGYGADWLIGNGGDNTFVGGPGDDILAGGRGADHFIYWNDPPHTSGGVDAILDFDGRAGDRFDISKISEDIGVNLTFIGAVTSHTSGVPYSVFYKKGIDPRDNPFLEGCPFKDQDGGPLFKGEDGISLMIDRDGDTHADLMIAVWGTDTITESDMIL